MITEAKANSNRERTPPDLAWARERSRGLTVLLMPEDVEDFGRRIVAAHPSVRFVIPTSRAVSRSMPADSNWVYLKDALLEPGLDLTIPELRNPAGMLIQLLAPAPRDDELATGDLGTVFNEADPGHVGFVSVVFRAMRQATKPHVEYLLKTPAPVRIGPAAERWWLEDDRRSFRNASTSHIYYRVRDVHVRSHSRDKPRVTLTDAD